MATRRLGGEKIAGMVSAGRVRAAGLELAYDHAGSGPPLVLVRGAGRSSDVPPDFELGGYATALAGLVETLGAPAHVCGLSWGGTVTLELYRWTTALRALKIHFGDRLPN
jgi:hypothetical protein